MQVHEFACSSLSLNEVPLACMQFHELVRTFFLCLSSSQEFRSACSTSLLDAACKTTFILAVIKVWQTPHSIVPQHPIILLYLYRTNNSSRKGGLLRKWKGLWVQFVMVCVLSDINCVILLWWTLAPAAGLSPQTGPGTIKWNLRIGICRFTPWQWQSREHHHITFTFP